jgi:hypothetical protein
MREREGERESERSKQRELPTSATTTTAKQKDDRVCTSRNSGSKREREERGRQEYQAVGGGVAGQRGGRCVILLGSCLKRAAWPEREKKG